VGVDTGGTFTDCVYVDSETNEIRVSKVPSDPSEPQAAIVAGLAALRMRDGASRDRSALSLESVTHGTTIATNAVLTGDLGRVGLITTRGFRDVLEIGTQQREKLYDLRQRSRPVLIPRQLRYEVSGRIDPKGNEVEALDIQEVESVVRELLDANVEAIAVAFLFSYVNPLQELEIRKVIGRLAPSLYVGCSGTISNELREFPRFVTAAINSALVPRVDPYLRGLQAEINARSGGTQVYVMQSNGGVATADSSVGDNIHRLILSGPAAGLIGSGHAALKCGFKSSVSFDVGGTSADVGILRDGEPRLSFELQLPNGVPFKLNHIELETIGAGGGSIGWVDAGGGLHVGPQSAGAQPGPACYGFGGIEPTVTDAHLVLGRLPSGGLIGGDLPLHHDAATASLERLAAKIGTSVEEAAIGMLAVLEENMVGAIRRAAARHGDDLRDFVLVAGGGAGPLHAASVMEALRMRAAVIPTHPGLLSALGLLSANIRHDRALPILALADDLSARELRDMYRRMQTATAVLLAEDRVDPQLQRFEYALELRYVGQDHTLAVRSAETEAVESIVGRFHRLHQRTFGHSDSDVAVEIVAVRTEALGLRPTPEIPVDLPAVPGQPVSARKVLFEVGGEWRSAYVYGRDRLAAGQVLKGPVIVEQLDATTIVPPRFVAQVHRSGALILTREARIKTDG
jgi:N-methylhydantoinase A